jgi:hypothetical protein
MRQRDHLAKQARRTAAPWIFHPKRLLQGLGEAMYNQLQDVRHLLEFLFKPGSMRFLLNPADL